MKNPKRTLLLTSAVLAAGAGGVWIYSWVKQHRKFCNSNEYKLHILRQQLQKSNGKDLVWLQGSLDQLFDSYTVDPQTGISALTVIGSIDSADQPSGHCNKLLNNGAFYYECYNCSTVRQSMGSNRNISEENCVYQSICEDCFDFTKHQGHQFKRRESSTDEVFRCSCGDECLTDKKSFCDKHQGYDGFAKIYAASKEEHPQEWQQIQGYFFDVFHLLFDTTTNALLEATGGRILKNTNNNEENLSSAIKEEFKPSSDFLKKSKEETLKANVLLGLILDKMEELLSQNSSYLCALVEILSSTLPKPLRIHLEHVPLGQDTFQDRSLFILTHPIINKQLSILELLLIHTRVISSENDKKFSSLLNKCIKADKSFRKLFAQKFFERIFLQLKCSQKSFPLEEGISVTTIGKLYELPTIAVAVMEHVSIFEVFQHLYDTLKEDFFKPLELLHYQLLVFCNEEPVDQSQMLYLLYNICVEVFKQIPMIDYALRVRSELLIRSLFNFSQGLLEATAQFFPIISEKQANPDEQIKPLASVEGDAIKFPLVDICLDRSKSLISISNFIFLEQQVSLCLINITKTLMHVDDEELTGKTLDILVRQFKENVEIVHKKMQMSEEIDKKLFLTFGCSLISMLPHLITVSERKVFTKQTVNDFFDKHFKTNKKEFISKLVVILQSYIPADKRSALWTSIRFVQEIAQESIQISQILNNSLAFIEHYLFSPSFRIYDGNILATQLLLLEVDKETRKKILDLVEIHYPAQYLEKTHFLEKYSSEGLQFIHKIVKSNYLKIIERSRHREQQILYDSTPMLNFYAANAKVFFSKDEYDPRFDNNIQEIAICSMSLNKDEQMTPPEIADLTKQILHYSCQLSFKNICDLPEPTENDIATLKESEHYKIYPRHYLRYFDVQGFITMSIADDSPGQDKILKNIRSDSNLVNIFTHQSQLLAIALMDMEYQEKLIREISKETMGPHFSVVYAELVFISLVMMLVFQKYHQETKIFKKDGEEGLNEENTTILVDEQNLTEKMGDTEEDGQQQPTGFDVTIKELNDSQVKDFLSIIKFYQQESTQDILNQAIESEVLGDKSQLTSFYEKNLLLSIRSKLDCLLTQTKEK